MRVVEGSLTMLGESVSSRAITKYSLIEIGGHVLQKIKVPDGINNFLPRALNQTGNTTLYLSGSMLLGIKLPDGKIYCYDSKIWKIAYHVAILGGLPIAEIFGLGVGAALFTAVIFIPFYINILAEIKNYSVSSDLKRQGAIAVAM